MKATDNREMGKENKEGKRRVRGKKKKTKH